MTQSRRFKDAYKEKGRVEATLPAPTIPPPPRPSPTLPPDTIEQMRLIAREEIGKELKNILVFLKTQA